MVIFYQGQWLSVWYWSAWARSGDSCCIAAMSAVPEVVVENCNGVDEPDQAAAAADVADQNGDDGWVTSVRFSKHL